LTELLVGVPFPVTPLEIMRFAVGPAVAGLALTGRTIGPHEASRIGLVDRVVDQEELVPEAVRRAASLGRIPASAYALTKEHLHRFTRHRIEELRPIDDPRATRLWESDEVRAAVAQYLGRLGRERAPRPD
jgi:enoyl-CoA hydratase